MSKCDDYLNEVCREVRFRAARKYVKQELSAHIDDNRSQLEQSGAADAEVEAVKAMGDAVQTGQALNAIHRPRVEWGVIACVILLCAAGIAVSLFSYNGGYRSELLEQIIGTTLGLGLMTALMFVDYQVIVRLRHIFFALGLLTVFVFLLFRDSLPSDFHMLVCNASAFFVLISIIGYVMNNKAKELSAIFKIGLFTFLAVFTLIIVPATMLSLILLLAIANILIAASLRGMFGHEHSLCIGIVVFAVTISVIIAVVIVPVMLGRSIFHSAAILITL